MDDPSGNPPPQKQGRSATQLTDLTLSRSADHKVPIEFDMATGKPTGPNRKKFNSFVAVTARSKATILQKNWGNVEPQVKDQIWQTIMATYDVPNDTFLKKKLISYAGKRWRAFKTTLTRRYIYGELKDKNPCAKYKFLDEETWNRFVYGRHDPIVQEERKKGQKIADKNKCPHRLSHRGYELLEQKMIEEKLKKRQEASQSDPSVVLSPPSPPTRHEKWKRARTKKSGEYTSKATRIIAEKIDSLVEQSSQGTFVPVGREDILTIAIGRPEHPGRVRAAGRGVGIRQYFGSTCHSSKVVTVPKEVIEALKEELTEQIEWSFAEKLKLKIREELASMGISQGNTDTQYSPTPTMVSTKGSNILVGEEILEEDLLNIPDECKLYIDDPLRLVAFGKVCNLGPTIHHKKISDDMVRVTVERVKDANAPVPVPTEEVQTVGQAPNNFILWPKRLVQLIEDKEANVDKDVPVAQQKEPQVYQEKEANIDKDVPAAQKKEPQVHQEKEVNIVTEKQNPMVLKKPQVHQEKEPDASVCVLSHQNFPDLDPIKRLCLVALDIGKKSIQLTLEPDVIGKATSIPLEISQDDIMEVCKGNEMLCVIVLQVWMIYLHQQCISKGHADKYGFLDPIHIQKIGNTVAEIEEYIKNRIVEGGKQCYLAPYFDSGHWQLIIICPQLNEIIFLCSLWRKPKKDLKALLDSLMKVYASKNMNAKNTTFRKKTRWIEPHRFTDPLPFHHDRIDDVRRRWANYFLQLNNF